MKHQRIELVKLVASAQPRPLITEAVDKLASSIREVGLIQPVTVKPCSMMIGGLAGQGYQIVAGHHRVAACRALGWTEIDALVIEPADHLSAELVEIDENLCRAELTAAQRAQAIKRRKEIWEALHPVVKAAIEVGEVCPPQNKHPMARQQEHGFAASTASVTGEAKRTINQHLARAEALGDDLPRVAGTSLDKGVELDALAKLPAPERAELIERAQAGEAVSARSTAPTKPRPIEEQRNSALEFAQVIHGALDSFRASFRMYSDEAMAKQVARDLDALFEDDAQQSVFFNALARLNEFIATAETGVAG